MTYYTQFAAHILDSTYGAAGSIAILPDEVARDQQAYDGHVITVLVDGTPLAARLRGDLYALGQSGTGDPIVELVDSDRQTAPRVYGIVYGDGPDTTIIELSASSLDDAIEEARATVARIAWTDFTVEITADLVILEGRGPVYDSDGEQIADTHAPHETLMSITTRETEENAEIVAPTYRIEQWDKRDRRWTSEGLGESTGWSDVVDDWIDCRFVRRLED